MSLCYGESNLYAELKCPSIIYGHGIKLLNTDI